jgi:hypothetical protein
LVTLRTPRWLLGSGSLQVLGAARVARQYPRHERVPSPISFSSARCIRRIGTPGGVSGDKSSAKSTSEVAVSSPRATEPNIEIYRTPAALSSGSRARSALKTWLLILVGVMAVFSSASPSMIPGFSLRKFCGSRSCSVVPRDANCNGRPLASC